MERADTIKLFVLFSFFFQRFFSWNVNMYKSFSWKLQASDSQTATSTEMSMNQTENKMYQQTDGLQTSNSHVRAMSRQR